LPGDDKDSYLSLSGDIKRSSRAIVVNA